jgi:hypothetical protein
MTAVFEKVDCCLYAQSRFSHCGKCQVSARVMQTSLHIVAASERCIFEMLKSGLRESESNPFWTLVRLNIARTSVKIGWTPETMRRHFVELPFLAFSVLFSSSPHISHLQLSLVLFLFRSVVQLLLLLLFSCFSSYSTFLLTCPLLPSPHPLPSFSPFIPLFYRFNLWMAHLKTFYFFFSLVS